MLRQRGFTLVEVLVALLIMAVMAAMGWQGVTGMVQARDIAAAASERTLRLSAVVGQWESDLGAIYDSPVVPGIAFDGSALRLVRRNGDGVQVVVWALREGRWQRWPGPVVQRGQALRESWLQSQQLQGREPEQLTVLDGATDWEIYFWRGQAWSNAQSSGDTVTETEPAAAPAPANAAPGATAPAATAPGTAAPGTTAPGTAVPGTTAPAAAAPAPTPVTRQRSVLPTGVRLQIDLPEGRILRDVLLTPAA
jgi:general secretion pathway protein J